jgi:hypothetical protein
MNFNNKKMINIKNVKYFFSTQNNSTAYIFIW